MYQRQKDNNNVELGCSFFPSLGTLGHSTVSPSPTSLLLNRVSMFSFDVRYNLMAEDGSEANLKSHRYTAKVD